MSESRPSAAVGSVRWLDELRRGVDVLALDLTSAQVQALADYLNLLLKWNRVYNLTSVTDPAQAVTHHLLDSLAVLPAVRKWAQHTDVTASGGLLRVLDVGSGGGLPGVVWAIAQPDWVIHCVDAVAKKAAFVQQAASSLGLHGLKGVHARVERLQGAYDLIVSRAFASLGDFTHLSQAALAPTGVWLALKGARPDQEIKQLTGDVDVFHVERVHVPGLAAQRCLVWMRPKVL